MTVGRNETQMCEPVFVVGMNGSGTSMMLDSLGWHPKLYALPYETLMMPHIIRQAYRFGNLDDDQNFIAYGRYAIAQIPALERIMRELKPELPKYWLALPRTIAGVFDGIFGSLAAAHNKQRWCEKTPDHVQHIEMLATIFSRAKFIHMIRDGREVACSINRRQHRQPELIIYRWKKLVAMGRAAGEKLDGRYLEVQYEDLTQNAREEMGKVCDFLRLEFSEEILRSRMPESPHRKHIMAKGEWGEIRFNPLKWPDYFDADRVRRLEEIAGRVLDEFGYAVGTQAGDKDPNFLLTKYWRGVDFMRHAVIQRKTTKRYNSWRKIAQKVVFSFKEYRSKRF